MTGNRLLVSLFLIVLSVGLAHSQQPQTMTGCVSQDTTGALHLLEKPSGRTYELQSDAGDLQRHINQQLEIRGYFSATQSASVIVADFRVIAESCTSALPSNERFAVPGKVGQVQAATPVTATGSANETTPGFQTQSGLEQAEHPNTASGGASGPSAKRGRRTAFGPAYPEHAGESEYAADINAQAASRAELYPGITLGVDLKTAPMSSIDASQQKKTSRTAKPK